mmetsp:Transcript_68694/g.121433  ORF Transcript_68694/g.121433 Transcript_68694/m.121433 type:complete len:90 (-) Transcript_68694:286-555(-)
MNLLVHFWSNYPDSSVAEHSEWWWIQRGPCQQNKYGADCEGLECKLNICVELFVSTFHCLTPIVKNVHLLSLPHFPLFIFQPSVTHPTG